MNIYMETFKIVFWKKPYVSDDSFVESEDSFLTSAIVSKEINSLGEVYHIKLIDIGLQSLYGEFDIICKNGFWQSADFDTLEFNFLKSNIISAIDFLNK